MQDVCGYTVYQHPAFPGLGFLSKEAIDAALAIRENNKLALDS